MKDIALYLLKNLVDNTEEVGVDEVDNGQGQIQLTIKVAQEDMGKIIGKNGRVIRSIRDIIKILALKKGVHVDVILAE